MGNNTFKNISSGKEELEQLLGNISKDNRIKLVIFGIVLIITFSLKMAALKVSWSIIGVAAFLFFLNVLSEFLARKVWANQNIGEVTQGYFIFQTVELMAFLILIYFLGALLFWGIGALIFYITFSFLIFTRKDYPWMIAFFATMIYFAFILLEYLGILPYMNIYHLEKNIIQKPSFLIPTLFSIAGLLITLAIYLDAFLRGREVSFKKLKDKLKRLREREVELGRVKAVLEKQLKAKEKQVEELTIQLKQEKSQREKESGRLKQLETFHKLAIERELKMKELKEEIKRLKKLLQQK